MYFSPEKVDISKVLNIENSESMSDGSFIRQENEHTFLWAEWVAQPYDILKTPFWIAVRWT